MLSLIGTIIGLLGSLAPKLLDYFKIKADHKHELDVLKVQAEMAKSEHMYRLEEIEVQADVSSEQAVYKQAEQKVSGNKFLDGMLMFYAGTVRPTVTYLFMGSYLFVKYAQLKVITAAGGDLWGTVWKLWNSEDMAVFCTILGFWFGGRLLRSNLSTFGVGTNGNGNGKKIEGHTQPVLIPVVPKPREKPKPGEIFNDPSTNNLSGF